MRKLKSCGILLFGPDLSEFLLMRHRNRWDLPKGHIEAEESELACARRELHEETGIDAAQITMLEGFRYTESYRTRYRRFCGAPVC
jgi:bis(5'-nucleosidyl)-tetraphosphatase